MLQRTYPVPTMYLNCEPGYSFFGLRALREALLSRVVKNMSNSYSSDNFFRIPPLKKKNDEHPAQVLIVCLQVAHLLHQFVMGVILIVELDWKHLLFVWLYLVLVESKGTSRGLENQMNCSRITWGLSKSFWYILQIRLKVIFAVLFFSASSF